RKELLAYKLGVSEERLNKILEWCFTYEILDKDLYDKYTILTSRKMQDDYSKVIERRAQYINMDYIYQDDFTNKYEVALQKYKILLQKKGIDIQSKEIAPQLQENVAQNKEIAPQKSEIVVQNEEIAVQNYTDKIRLDKIRLDNIREDKIRQDDIKQETDKEEITNQIITEQKKEGDISPSSPSPNASSPSSPFSSQTMPLNSSSLSLPPMQPTQTQSSPMQSLQRQPPPMQPSPMQSLPMSSNAFAPMQSLSSVLPKPSTAMPTNIAPIAEPLNSSMPLAQSPESSAFTIDNFKAMFPSKYTSKPLIVPENVNLELLAKKIKEQPWLLNKNHLDWAWCLNHYIDIINNKYADFSSTNSVNQENSCGPRKYTKEYLDSLYDDISTIKL
ncbi:MAG: DUF4373 domain-containing protein, partial [Clostridia bacterium]|nr:DUF4373 domain-containing protein [Clostridia bacterium]